jgi:branched-chain amino acid transport system ATP-binding protein
MARFRPNLSRKSSKESLRAVAARKRAERAAHEAAAEAPVSPAPEPVAVSAPERVASPAPEPSPARGDGNALLQVSDVDVFYGSVQALRGVTLQISAGERVALLGANGAGKTTTLRTISGLLAPRRGSIVFDGEEIGGLPAYAVVGKGIAHGPEGRALFPGLSVEENLRFGYLPRRKEKHGYAAALDRVFAYFPRLEERRKQAAGTMSGGEQQMLVVARALMSSPKLLIVDELSLGLAPKIVALLFDIIRDVNAEGTAVLIVEQFVHMALANTDRAYVLAKGEIVLEGRSQELAGSEELLASYLGGEVDPAGETGHGEQGNGRTRRRRTHVG